MRHLAWLWLGVPLAGLAELGAHVYYAHAAPSTADWAALRPVVERLRQRDELVVVAPYWAEPLARASLGDALMPLADVARADETAYPAALEVSLLGQRAPELRGWKLTSEERAGPFRLRRLENPAPALVSLDFVEALGPRRVTVLDGEAPALGSCRWSARSGMVAGGLHGHTTFPRERFVCPGGLQQFVGVTIVEDEQYRPRRCIWAQPPERGVRVLHYADVPLGSVIRGHTLTAWFLTRDRVGDPIELRVRVDGVPLATVVHHDADGWRSFELPLGELAHTTADVELEVRSTAADERHFCFEASTR